MLEYFTETAQQVIGSAHAEAQAFGHDHLDTTHLLLGLLILNQDPTAKVLADQGVTLQDTRTRVGTQREERSHQSGRLPFTTAAKTALERSIHEAIARHQTRTIEPPDLLLALLADQAGTATSMLIALDANPGQIREQLLNNN